MTRLTPGRTTPGTAPWLTSAGVSVVVHALVIGAVVYSGSRPPGPERELPGNSIVRFLAPPNREAGQQPRREMVQYVALGLPEGLGASVGGAVSAALGEPRDIIEPTRVVSGLDQRDQAAMPSLPGMDSVYLVIDVDSAAMRYEWSAAPAYPPSMLEQRAEGFVKAQWVVDELGYADTTTLAIIEATHSAFAKAVRDALPFMRFSPAKIGNTRVRQLVQQDFWFRVQVADTSAARKPGT